MTFTVNQLQALKAAIASGTRTVSYDGKTVTYASTAELIAAKNIVEGELIAAGLLQPLAGTNRGPSTLASFNRG